MRQMNIKKIFFIFFTTATVVASAQTKLGLKVAPVISSNRVTSDAQTIVNDRSSFNFSIGLVVDMPFSDSHFLSSSIMSSGIMYIPKRAGIRTDSSYTEEYTIQYLQIPVTLKLFTNEIAPDLKSYFQVGGGLEVKIFDKKKNPDYFIVEKFNVFDFSVILGAGVEYRAGINTVLFGGISYQRGLVNTISQTVAGVDKLQLRNTILSLDLGVKF